MNSTPLSTERYIETKHTSGLAKTSFLEKKFITPSLLSLIPECDSIPDLLHISENKLFFPDGKTIQLFHTPFYPDFVDMDIGRERTVSDFQNILERVTNETSGEYFGVPVPSRHISSLPLNSALSQKKIVLFQILGLSNYLNNSRVLVKALSMLSKFRTVNHINYLPGSVSPHWMYLLAFLGIDIFDNSYALFAASKGYLINPNLSSIYLFLNPNEFVSESGGITQANTFEELSIFNTSVLSNTLNTIRRAIKDNSLRDIVERICVWHPSLLSPLRIVDQQGFMQRYTNYSKPHPLLSVPSFSLTRSVVTNFQNRVSSDYNPRSPSLFLLIPCSARKPYFLSQSYKAIYHTLSRTLKKKQKDICVLTITSPLGVVPEELTLTYPAAHYDISVTGTWDSQERKTVHNILSSIFAKSPDTPIVQYTPESYSPLFERFNEVHRIPVEGSIRKRANLSMLENHLSNIQLLSTDRSSLQNNRVRNFAAICDFQFGKGTGSLLTTDTFSRGRYPSMQYLLTKQGNVATLRSSSGLLTMGRVGAERIYKNSRSKIIFDGENLKGSTLFASGISRIDGVINPGDEVFVTSSNDKLIATGTSLVPGDWMLPSHYGAVVSLRKVFKSVTS